MASYRKSHIKGKILKIKPEKPIFKKLWFWVIILIIIFVGCGLYLLFFYQGIQVKNIIISGNAKVKTQDLQNIISEDSNTRIIDFWNVKINSRSIFIIAKNKINSDILDRFPQIDSVKVNIILPQTLVANIIERNSVAIYCADSSEKNCFFIDELGVIFEEIDPTKLSSEYFIVRQVFEELKISKGQKIIDPNKINVILKIQKDLKDNFQMGIKTADVVSSTRLNIVTNEGWEIYLDLNSDYDIKPQMTKMNLLLNDMKSVGDRNKLRYIDLRPKDRAIICDNKICGG